MDRKPIAPRPGNWQQRVYQWALSCFGRDVTLDKHERSMRFLEESLELVQAAGLHVDDALRLVLYVYGRDTGALHQELGGVMVTLAAFCNAHDLTMEAAADAELDRVWLNIERIREKHNQKAARGIGKAIEP